MLTDVNYVSERRTHNLEQADAEEEAMERDNEGLTKPYARILLQVWVWLALGVMMCYFEQPAFAVAALIIAGVKLLRGAVDARNAGT